MEMGEYGPYKVDISEKYETKSSEIKDTSLENILRRIEILHSKAFTLDQVLDESSKRNYGCLKGDELEPIALSDGYLPQMSEILNRIELIILKATKYLEDL